MNQKIISFMKKKIVLNFWNALLMLISIRVISPLLVVIIPLSFPDFYKTDEFFKIYLQYLEYLLLVPFIFLFAKKTNTNFKNLFPIPDVSTILKMIVIIFLVRFIVTVPLNDIYFFILSLMNAKLCTTSTAIAPFSPLLDFKMIVFIPIIEELLFRGLILTNFLKKYAPVYAILLSSILFSAHHLSLDNLIFHLATGIIYGILFYTTNSLIIVSLSHIIFNVCSKFPYEFIDLSMANSIQYLFIYATALGLLIFLLKRSLKKVSRRDAINLDV